MRHSVQSEARTPALFVVDNEAVSDNLRDVIFVHLNYLWKDSNDDTSLNPAERLIAERVLRNPQRVVDALLQSPVLDTWQLRAPQYDQRSLRILHRFRILRNNASDTQC